jgi:hypothetical protein
MIMTASGLEGPLCSDAPKETFVEVIPLWDLREKFCMPRIPLCKTDSSLTGASSGEATARAFRGKPALERPLEAETVETGPEESDRPFRNDCLTKGGAK